MFYQNFSTLLPIEPHILAYYLKVISKKHGKTGWTKNKNKKIFLRHCHPYMKWFYCLFVCLGVKKKKKKNIHGRLTNRLRKLHKCLWDVALWSRLRSEALQSYLSVKTQNKELTPHTSAHCVHTSTVSAYTQDQYNRHAQKIKYTISFQQTETFTKQFPNWKCLPNA